MWYDTLNAKMEVETTMCRLAYIPKPFDGMRGWLEQMERSAGGHGGGVAANKWLLKGVQVDARSTAREMLRVHNLMSKQKRRLPPFLWHTRRTSSGGHHDDLCHPFACAGGHLAHNGHWQAMHVQAQKIEGVPMSDTRLFSFVVDKGGFIDAVLDAHPPGVWLHMRDGQLAAWKSGGSLVYCPDTRVWGSEPAAQGRWYDVADGVYDYGEEPYLTTVSLPSRPKVKIKRFDFGCYDDDVNEGYEAYPTTLHGRRR